MPVDRWGVQRYIIKNLGNSCFQLRPSAWAALMAFANVLLKCSTVALAAGQYGVISRCLIPQLFRNDLKSYEVNWGPLSETISAG